MVLPVTFAGLSLALVSQLDDNFAALGVLTVLHCTITGTNDLVLTPAVNAPTVAIYTKYQVFLAVAPATNTGPVTARVGTLAAHPVYMDTLGSAIPLSNHEIVGGNVVMLMWDPALNGGGSGFHLLTVPPLPRTGGAPATVSASTGTTLTAAQLTGAGWADGVLIRAGSPSGNFNDTTDTATNIIAALPGGAVDTYFHLRVVNTSGHTQTLLAGSGVTVVGTATTANAATHDFVGVVTNVGTPAVIIYG